MMTIIEFMLKSMLIVLILPAGYLLTSTIASYRFRKQEPARNRFLNIGVLIPAHNEEEGIVRTIESIRSGDYPANRFEVWVIADNCNDRTAERARQAGAQVYERVDRDLRGKGFALDWFLKNHRNECLSTDAIAIIDADVVADRSFLCEMSASLSNPDIRVVQAYNGVSNPHAGWRPALIDAAFNIFNHLRMAGSFMLSGTSVLKGNGMGFRTHVLERYGWPCHSIVEDMEFTLELLREGIPVHYNPDAVVRSEMVTSGKNASSQRARWEGGRFMLVRQMTRPLLTLFRKSGETRYLYALAELAIPPLSMLAMLFGLATCAAPFLGLPWVALAAGFWGVLVFYLVSGQIQRKAPVSTWLYLAAAPLYILWKIPLYAGMVIGRNNKTWIRTTREASNM
jgi:cellulose synthase/poly-beta-1,6-N-acetylglucosamine synthase-like glycosyltransferase